MQTTLPDILLLPDRPNNTQHGAANSAPLEALLALVSELPVVLNP